MQKVMFGKVLYCKHCNVTNMKLTHHGVGNSTQMFSCTGCGVVLLEQKDGKVVYADETEFGAGWRSK